MVFDIMPATPTAVVGCSSWSGLPYGFPSTAVRDLGILIDSDDSIRSRASRTIIIELFCSAAAASQDHTLGVLPSAADPSCVAGLVASRLR